VGVALDEPLADLDGAAGVGPVPHGGDQDVGHALAPVPGVDHSEVMVTAPSSVRKALIMPAISPSTSANQVAWSSAAAWASATRSHASRGAVAGVGQPGGELARALGDGVEPDLAEQRALVSPDAPDDRPGARVRPIGVAGG
jgi:hypothetical protein